MGLKNTTKSVLNEYWEYNRFKGDGFGWKIKDKSDAYDFKETKFSCPTPIHMSPPWMFPMAKADFSVIKLKRKQNMTVLTSI